MLLIDFARKLFHKHEPLEVRERLELIRLRKREEDFDRVMASIRKAYARARDTGQDQVADGVYVYGCPIHIHASDVPGAKKRKILHEV